MTAQADPTFQATTLAKEPLPAALPLFFGQQSAFHAHISP